MIRFRDLALIAIVWIAAGLISDALQMERLIAGVFIASMTLAVMLVYWRWEDARS
jgi:hypothetical protein